MAIVSTQFQVNVGDQVVHPHHGLGVVTATSMVDLGEGPVPYVTIAIDGGMTLKVPAASLQDRGIREPVTVKHVEEILDVLTKQAPPDPGHAVRRRIDVEKLASGELIQCAEVVRDLTAIVAAQGKGGSQTDRNMLDSARNQLAAEVALVLGTTPEEALERIDEALAKAPQPEA